MSHIVLKVATHPSGRNTLMMRVDGHAWSDLRGPLFGNLDKASFDRAKDELVAKQRQLGHHVEVKE